MRHFIELTEKKKGYPVVFNVDNICCFDFEPGDTVVFLTSGGFTKVRENMEEVRHAFGPNYMDQ